MEGREGEEMYHGGLLLGEEGKRMRWLVSQDRGCLSARDLV